MDYTPLEMCLPRKIVDCLVRGPYPALLQIECNAVPEDDEHDSPPAAQIFFDPFGPGCKYLELHFPRPTDVGEIHFLNHYTAIISLHVQSEGMKVSFYTKFSATLQRLYHTEETDFNQCLAGFSMQYLERDSGAWHVALPRKQLMPHPHTEEGSQDAVSLTEKDSAVPWAGVTQMRLIMRQPSAEWADFEIDRLVVFGDEPKHVHKNVLYLGQHLEEMDAAVALTRLNTDEALRSTTYEDCYEFSGCIIYD